MLKDKVVPWVNAVIVNEGVTLQQDGATSHTARRVNSWCENNFKSFWPKELWPPLYPDLNPMDFGVWSILEQKACTVLCQSIQALKQKFTESWEEIESETLCAMCKQIVPHLCCLMHAKGGYIK